jgi:hypothetical protein
MDLTTLNTLRRIAESAGAAILEVAVLESQILSGS